MIRHVIFGSYGFLIKIILELLMQVILYSSYIQMYVITSH